MSFTNETICLTKLAVADLLLEGGCEEARIPTRMWFRLLESEQSVVKELWLECLANAAPALLDEGYGKLTLEDKDMSLVDMVDWKRVPPQLFVCVVLGLDCLVTTAEGTTLGVISTVEGDLEEVQHLNKMRPLLDYLCIDGILWCQVNLEKEQVEALNMAHKKCLVHDMSNMLAETDFSEGWLHTWVIEADLQEDGISSDSLDSPVDVNEPTKTTFTQGTTKTVHSTFPQDTTKTNVNPVNATVSLNLSE